MYKYALVLGMLLILVCGEPVLADAAKDHQTLAETVARYTMTTSFKTAEDSDQIAAADDRRWTFTAYVENDSGRLKPNDESDRHYTNGVRIALTHQPEIADDLGRWLESQSYLNWWFVPIADASTRRTAMGYTIGQLIFTPGDIQVPALIEDDRPYAGWLYAGVYWQRSTDHLFDHVELQFGTTGRASLAQDAQIWIHELFDDPEPRGWGNQLGNEVGFNVNYRRKFRLYREIWENGFGVEVIPSLGFALGTVHRHIEGAVMARVGLNLPWDFGPDRFIDPIDATRRDGNEGWSVYGFIVLTGRVVEHDLFLEGNEFRDSHSVSARPFVGELTLGIAAQYQNFRLGYYQTFQTDTFRGQGRADSWGGLVVALTFTY